MSRGRAPGWSPAPTFPNQPYQPPTSQGVVVSFMPSVVTRDEVLIATKPLRDLIGLTEFEIFEVAVKSNSIEVIAGPIHSDGKPHVMPVGEIEEGDAREFSQFCYTAHIEIVDAEVKA